jgi:RNA polymerase sigma factor (sigma-70 family)
MGAANLGLVHCVLRQMHVPDRNWDDVYQAAVFGLARAVQLFDASAGVAFSTYASHGIRHAVVVQWYRDRLVRVPMAAARAQREATARAWRVCECDEDTPCSDETLPSDAAAHNEERRLLTSLLRRLDAREQLVLRRRRAGSTFAELAAELALTRERVRQIERDAVNAIRDHLETHEA